MENNSVTGFVKRYGVAFFVIIIVIGIFKYGGEQPPELVKEGTGIPANKDILYDDEKASPSPLPDEVMPQFPVIYKSRGVITASIIHREPTLYGDVVVFDYFNTTRCFLIEGVNESCWNFRNESPSGYTRDEKLILEYLADLQDVKDVLVIGVGAGTLLKDLEGKDLKIDGVDINPAMKDIAQKFFRLPENLDFEYIIDDGRHFLNTTDKKYDAIVLDLCYVNSANSHLWTKEFYALAKDKLKDPATGFLIASRGIVTGEQNEQLDAMIGTAMLESFSNLYQVKRNDEMSSNEFDMGVYIASNSVLDFSGLSIPTTEKWIFDTSVQATTDQILDQLVELFLPATDKIREQTLENWGKDMFLTL